MRAIILSLALLGTPAFAQLATADKPAFTEADAIAAIKGGFCGFMPLGNGFGGNKGFIHEPIPGPVIVRTASDSGTIQTIEMRSLGIAPQHSVTLDVFPGKPYYLMVNWAMSGDHLEWKVPGHAWGPIPLGFQLPPLDQVAPRKP